MAQPPSNSGIQQTYTWRQQLSNQIGFARQPPSFCRSAQHPTELKIKVDSLDCVAIEGILVDVFMKYTLQFRRTCFTTPSGSYHARGSKMPKPERTLPYDTTLKEQVIRQQYTLYEAKVKDTRKRKDFPTHIVQRVEAAA
ncbi:hypothetical protein PCANC_26104 [Puccinia coronata f. sp. avenae]|uniref:Uncharacterized protein n=1 Tax=Puccinia coronata f. sp. avenae TaxID=200324 RepID=A0A2N5TP47_9BASI|nr:hypothetical protein PCANC_26104 [Puccinia coronata f. sp. avenae]PLW35754.1 hypothetical protein PCASD_20633 [Puccinia coronata f. sp. avenae]